MPSPCIQKGAAITPTSLTDTAAEESPERAIVRRSVNERNQAPAHACQVRAVGIVELQHSLFLGHPDELCAGPDDEQGDIPRRRALGHIAEIAHEVAAV